MSMAEVPYTESEDILGMPIVGYRYGEAPEEGFSYNSRESMSLAYPWHNGDWSLRYGHLQSQTSAT